MKHLLTIISLFILFAACSKDDDSYEAPPEPAQRTVIVYMSGENNLSSYLQNDLNEMKSGRQQVAANENLVVFVDRASTTEMPYIAKITAEGNMEKLYDNCVKFDFASWKFVSNHQLYAIADSVTMPKAYTNVYVPK